MPPSPLPADKLAEAQALAQAIQEATEAAVEDLARNLVATDDQHLFGANEFKIRDIAHKIAAKAVEQHLAQEKNGYQGASVTCPHCGQAAEVRALLARQRSA